MSAFGWKNIETAPTHSKLTAWHSSCCGVQPRKMRFIFLILEKANIQELKFDFYTLLKDNEILIPDDQEAQSNSINPDKNAQYLLQAGSFKNVQDAENRKVQLLLLNLPAVNERVTSKNGDIWHRVLVGPFVNTSKIASARAKLAQNEIDSLLLKRSQ